MKKFKVGDKVIVNVFNVFSDVEGVVESIDHDNECTSINVALVGTKKVIGCRSFDLKKI